jgi:hypothetical protein
MSAIAITILHRPVLGERSDATAPPAATFGRRRIW